MPYGKRYDRKMKKWVVFKKSNGKRMGTHQNEEKANKQLAALYANESKEDK